MGKKLLFLVTCAIFLLGANISFAGDGSLFQTFEGKTSTADTANPGWWAYQPVTGTRYVFRINGKDVGDSGEGGKGSQNYYINHVKDSTNLMTHNPSAAEEKEGEGNTRNWELVYVGTFLNNTIAFDAVAGNWHFFDTPCSSISEYTTTLNGEKQYRHIIVWKRSSKYSSDTVYTNDFGLNGSDIKKLVGALKIRANALNDTATLNQISQIESGLVDYEIRAEILMSERTPDDSGTGTVIGKDVYADYNTSTRMYYTYREAQAVQIEIDNYAPAAIYNHFGRDTARQLVEMHTPWTTEYDSNAVEYKNALGDALRGYYANGNKRNYFSGFDYIDISADNPYESTTTPVNIVYQSVTGKVLKTESEEIPAGQSEEFKASDLGISHYTHIGTKADNVDKGTASSVVVEADGQSHTIIFTYDQKVNIKVIGVRDDGTTTEFTKEENTQITKDGISREYSYTTWGKNIFLNQYSVSYGSTTYDKNKTYTKTNGNKASFTIRENDDANQAPTSEVLVIFYFRQPVVKVYFETINGVELEKWENLKFDSNDNFEFNSSDYINLIHSSFIYHNTVKDDVEHYNMPSVELTNNGKDRIIKFRFKQLLSIKVIGVRDDGTTTEFTKEENIQITKDGISREYSYTTWGKNIFLNQYSISYGSTTYDKNKTYTKTNGNKASFTIRENDDANQAPTSEVLVIFYFRQPVVKVYFKTINGLELAKWENLKFDANDNFEFDSSKYIGLIHSSYIYEDTYIGSEKSTDKKVTLTNTGTDRTVIFRFKQKVSLRVVGVCEGSSLSQYALQQFYADELVLPTAKKEFTYNNSDWKTKYSEWYNTHQYTGKYAIDETTTSYTGQSLTRIEGNMATVDAIAEPDSKEDQVPSQILVIFYFESLSKIKYMDERTGKEIEGVSSTTATPGVHTAPDLTSMRYNYTGVQIVKPASAAKAKDSSTNKVTIPKDTQIYEVIFWYRQPTEVNITWTRVSSNGDETVIQTSKDTAAPNNNNSKTYSGDVAVGFIGHNYEYIGNQYYKSPDTSGTRSSAASVTISDDGNVHNIIFYYEHNATLVVKKSARAKIPYTVDVRSSEVGIPYQENILRPTWANYTYLNEYQVEYTYGGNLAYLGEVDNLKHTGDTANINITENPDPTAQPITGVLVVFLYESDYEATIKYLEVDPDTKAVIGNVCDSNGQPVNDKKIMVTAGNPINVGSYSDCATNNYANYSEPVIEIDDMPVEQSLYTINNYVANGQDAYSVEVKEAKENDYEINFYYYKQQLEVRHEWENGGLVKNDGSAVEISYLPVNDIKPLSNYKCVGYTLNNGTLQTKTPISVSVSPNVNFGAKQVLKFIYSAAPIIASGETEVIPETINNQLVGQVEGEKYWVLDNNNHELTIKIKAEPAGETTITGYDANVKLPFDVYLNGVLYKGGTSTINVPATEFVGGTAKISNIFVPIWVDEKSYDDIKAALKVSSSYTAYDESGSEVTQTASSSCEKTAKVTVVGRVYDFSITNIEGDDKWKNSLFTATKTTHKADTLPLGQDNGYQPSKYVTGILKGANIYFSLNTKGSDNGSIKITPRFYHVSQDGNVTQEVDLYSKGKLLDESQAIPLSRKEYRETTEYIDEILKAKELYTTVNYEEKTTIGNAIELLLDKPSRTPYKGYLDEAEYSNIKTKLPTGKSEDDILKEVSHWYGNYSIPNDAVACVKGTKNQLKDGFIVVYFNIVTQRDNNDYLAYNLPSPTKTTGETEWDVERKAAGANYLLPRVSAKQTDQKEVNPWLWKWMIDGTNVPEKGTAATIIYEADKASSYTTVGTH